MAESTTGRSSKDARREEILDAAFQEFSEKGYSGASMEAIARRARCSKETLYSWFEDKKKLFNTLYTLRLERVGAGAREAAQSDPLPTHVLPVIARATLKLVLAMAPLTQAALSAVEHGQPVTRAIGENFASTREVFVTYLKWCRAEGLIAFDEDPYELASVFVAMAQGEWALRVALGQVDAVTEEMIEAHAQRVTRLFLKAVAPATK